MSDLVLFQPVRAWDRNGVFSPGAKAYFYEPGTSTPRTVYSDAALSVAHPTPLAANARGIFAPVYTSGQVDYLIRDADDVVLVAQAPAFLSAATGAAAGGTSFEPTADIPVDDVQAAIERVQANYEGDLAALGFGITGSAPLLANFNATNIPSGTIYRFDMAVTTGTGASDWGAAETGVFVFWRESVDSGLAIAASRDDGYLWARLLAGGAWGSSWQRVTGPVQDQATWNAGTGATEGLITPAKLEASIRYRRQRFVAEKRLSSGTGGGSATGGTWHNIVLNTEVENSIDGASIDTGTGIITLPAGEYRLEDGWCATMLTNGAQAQLYNEDATAEILRGASTYSNSGVSALSHVTGLFSLSAETDVRLRLFAQSSQATTGLGGASSSGLGEVYARVSLVRLGDYIA